MVALANAKVTYIRSSHAQCTQPAYTPATAPTTCTHACMHHVRAHACMHHVRAHAHKRHVHHPRVRLSVVYASSPCSCLPLFCLCPALGLSVAVSVAVSVCLTTISVSVSGVPACRTFRALRLMGFSGRIFRAMIFGSSYPLHTRTQRREARNATQWMHIYTRIEPCECM